MKKTLVKLLILTLVATNVSILLTSVAKASYIDKTKISLKSEKSYDDVIIKKGSILTYSDFHEISEKVSILEEKNEEVTDTLIKKLIVEKIENKSSHPSRTKRSYSIFGRNVTGEELKLVSAFADAHESETPEGPDKTMDLNNNGVGRRLGNYTDTKSELLSEIVRYCDNGWLNRVVNNKLTDTDSSGKN